MSTFLISPDREAALAQRLVAAGVRESDLEESFVRSGGPGGQNVNKTATCVLLVHRPSGIQVKCQTTRQQGLNRFLARQLLAAKIESLRQQQADQKRAERERTRRQKRGRSRQAKQRILADKAHRAARKGERRRVGVE